MESFVERIIETDRKARELIEAAQNQQKKLEKDTRAAAQKALEARATADKAAMDKMDEEFSVRQCAAMDAADRDYITAKHALDTAFDAGRDAWLQELTAACLAVK